MADEKKNIMTTDAGRPVGDNQNSLTVGPRGPVVFEDFLLFEKMAHFNRERIPERQPHAKGGGAFGTFVVKDGSSHGGSVPRFLQQLCSGSAHHCLSGIHI